MSAYTSKKEIGAPWPSWSTRFELPFSEAFWNQLAEARGLDNLAVTKGEV